MAQVTPESAIFFVWLAWAASWFVAAIWASRAQSRPGLKVEAAYQVVTAVGVALLFFSGPQTSEAAAGWPRLHRVLIPLPAALTRPLWSLPPAAAWGCVGLTLVGFAFAWWARLHLGRLWSGTITRKADHHIVDTGPYALVRHPIYTGILLAAFALAAVKGTGAALAGAAVVTLGLWLKGRFEEGFLSTELGAEAYAAYRRRVPMLVPFLRA